jgi:hypothetical protein
VSCSRRWNFLAHHYVTFKRAYQLLLDGLMVRSRDGGFYLTTADPQGALKTDLIKVRQHYFKALWHLFG